MPVQYLEAVMYDNNIFFRRHVMHQVSQVTENQSFSLLQCGVYCSSISIVNTGKGLLSSWS